MRAHWRYLRYVLRHKFFVLRAGIAIDGTSPRWLWRLLVHDRSKFSRAEWGPYVQSFYGPKRATQDEERAVRTAFNVAWLHHIHANPHHWQHWILREDSGKTILLLPPAAVVNEMIADWLAAGPKVHRAHSMADAVRETILWYAGHHDVIQLRTPVRHHVEATLLALSARYGISELAATIESAAATRASIVIPGR